MSLKHTFLKYFCTKSIEYESCKMGLRSYKATLRKCQKQNTELEIVCQEKQKTIERYEELLANRNAKDIHTQAIQISQHCIYRYKVRLQRKITETDEEIRQKIYRLLVRNLKTMDKLIDGTYPLDNNMVCRVKDNTAVTCMKRKGSR